MQMNSSFHPFNKKLFSRLIGKLVDSKHVGPEIINYKALLIIHVVSRIKYYPTT